MGFHKEGSLALALILLMSLTIDGTHNTGKPEYKTVAGRTRVSTDSKPVEKDNSSTCCNSGRVANYGPTVNIQHISQSQGIFPQLAVFADSAHKRSECGIGALMPWMEKLYLVTYLSVPDGGNGTGLYSIDKNMQVRCHMALPKTKIP